MLSSRCKPITHVAVTGAAVVLLTLSGCATEDESDGELAVGEMEVPDIRGEDDFTDPYTGEYDEAFLEDVNVYAGNEVTLRAQVDDVYSPSAFTIVGPEGVSVEPILVVATEDVETEGLEEGLPVTVAATPAKQFDLAEVESELGVDLEDGQYEEWEDRPFLMATIVEEATE